MVCPSPHPAGYLLIRTGRAAFCNCLDSAEEEKHALQLKAEVLRDTEGLSSGAPFACAKVSAAGFVLVNAAMMLMCAKGPDWLNAGAMQQS